MHEEDMVRPWRVKKITSEIETGKVEKSTHAILRSPLDSDHLDFNIRTTGTVRDTAHCAAANSARMHDGRTTI